MSTDFIQLFFLFATLAACSRPLGLYIARVYQSQHVFLTPVVGRLETLIYRVCGIQSRKESNWKRYCWDMLAFSLLNFTFVFGWVLLQGITPENPRALAGLPLHTAWNLAASFVTNTDWQSYTGEAQLSAVTQMVAISLTMFLSAAVGMAVAAALFRGLKRVDTDLIGNFWVDVTRSILYVLLPLSIIMGLILSAAGTVQTWAETKPIVWMDTAAYPAAGAEGAIEPQLITGPVASFTAIKQIGSNGGGYYGANSAHPLENPNGVTNWLMLLAILLIPCAFPITFGVMVGEERQGWMMWAVMATILLLAVALSISQETREILLHPNVLAGGNMEGKEWRFGTVTPSVWAVLTTATSNGSANAAYSSLMPLTLLPMILLMQLGEVIFGGVGTGVAGMLVYVLITVFLAGLMVGRTPEFLGKKVGIFEIKLASLLLLLPAVLTLLPAAVGAILQMHAGDAGLINHGPRAFSELLYGFSSAANNNGSAMGGFEAARPFYDYILGFTMLIGRFGSLVLILAIAGAFCTKPHVAKSAGTLPTHTPLFAGMLACVVLLFGALTYAPALALGPVAEHLTMEIPHE